MTPVDSTNFTRLEKAAIGNDFALNGTTTNWGKLGDGKQMVNA